MNTRTIGISDHAYDRFAQHIQKGLTRSAIGNALRSIYRDSIPVTLPEMKRWRIRYRPECIYYKGKYRLSNGDKATVVLVVSADNVIKTVIKVTHEGQPHKAIPAKRRWHRGKLLK